MTKICCDICGKEMSSSMIRPTIELKFCISSFGRVWDICNDCRNDLNEFIKKHKEEKDAT